MEKQLHKWKTKKTKSFKKRQLYFNSFIPALPITWVIKEMLHLKNILLVQGHVAIDMDENSTHFSHPFRFEFIV